MSTCVWRAGVNKMTWGYDRTKDRATSDKRLQGSRIRFGKRLHDKTTSDKRLQDYSTGHDRTVNNRPRIRQKWQYSFS